MEREEADKPAIDNAPLVEVKFKAPVVSVSPFDPVKVWVEVNEPLLVVSFPVLPILND